MGKFYKRLRTTDVNCEVKFTQQVITNLCPDQAFVLFLTANWSGILSGTIKGQGFFLKNQLGNRPETRHVPRLIILEMDIFSLIVL